MSWVRGCLYKLTGKGRKGKSEGKKKKESKNKIAREKVPR